MFKVSNVLMVVVLGGNGQTMDCAKNIPTNTEEDPERPKRLDENVCSCPSYIVTIDPPKNTEKYSADDKAVWSNIKSFIKKYSVNS